MTPEQTFEQLLGLGEEWRVINTHYEAEKNTFVIAVEETPKLWESESRRNRFKTTCYDHVEPMMWRHLNVFNKECVIVCALPRGRYVDDEQSKYPPQKIYRVQPPWEGLSKHFSREFEAFALMLMKEMPVKKAGEILGETDQRLWRMLTAHVDRAYKRSEMDDVTWVGADEMNRRKGHNYLTVFADLRNRRVVFATEGKGADTWQAFADELLKHNGHPKAVTQAAIDMSAAYIKGVENNLGNAEIVFDKFHVVAQVNDAVEKVRREEARSSAMKAAVLKKTQWIWRKNPENWTDGQALRMDDLEREHLLTAKAYQMRLVMQGVYECQTSAEAKGKFEKWCGWVRKECEQEGNELLQPMLKAAEMIGSHLQGILGHWKKGLTTAFLEGLNSLFSATKRKARGYRTTTNMITMLYFVAGKLKIPA